MYFYGNSNSNINPNNSLLFDATLNNTISGNTSNMPSVLKMPATNDWLQITKSEYEPDTFVFTETSYIESCIARCKAVVQGEKKFDGNSIVKSNIECFLSQNDDPYSNFNTKVIIVKENAPQLQSGMDGSDMPARYVFKNEEQIENIYSMFCGPTPKVSHEKVEIQKPKSEEHDSLFYKNEIDRLNSESNTLLERNSKLENKIETFAKETIKLTENSQRLEEQVSKLQKSVNFLNQTNEELQQSLDTSNKSIEDLQKENLQQQKTIGDLEKKLKENVPLLQNENEQIRRSDTQQNFTCFIQESYYDLISKVAKLSSKIVELNNVKDKNNSYIDKLERELYLKQSQKKLDEEHEFYKNNDYKLTIESQQSEILSLKQEISNSQIQVQKNDEEEKIKLKNESYLLQLQVMKKDQELSKLKEQINTLESNNFIKDNKNDQLSLENDNQKVKNTLLVENIQKLEGENKDSIYKDDIINSQGQKIKQLQDSINAYSQKLTEDHEKLSQQEYKSEKLLENYAKHFSDALKKVSYFRDSEKHELNSIDTEINSKKNLISNLENIIAQYS